MTTYTPNLRLTLPPFDSMPWDESVNGNFSSLDAIVGRYLYIPNYAGIWINSTDYSVGQNVSDADDSSLWVCQVNHTTPPKPTTFAQDRTAQPARWIQAAASAADYAAQAAASAAQSSASATAAQTSAIASQNSANSSAASYNTFISAWYGPLPTAPLVDPLGNPPTVGDVYFDTSFLALQVFNGTAWQSLTTGGGGGGGDVPINNPIFTGTVTGPIIKATTYFQSAGYYSKTLGSNETVDIGWQTGDTDGPTLRLWSIGIGGALAGGMAFWDPTFTTRLMQINQFGTMQVNRGPNNTAGGLLVINDTAGQGADLAMVKGIRQTTYSGGNSGHTNSVFSAQLDVNSPTTAFEAGNLSVVTLNSSGVVGQYVGQWGQVNTAVVASGTPSTFGGYFVAYDQTTRASDVSTPVLFGNIGGIKFSGPDNANRRVALRAIAWADGPTNALDGTGPATCYALLQALPKPLNTLDSSETAVLCKNGVVVDTIGGTGPLAPQGGGGYVVNAFNSSGSDIVVYANETPFTLSVQGTQLSGATTIVLTSLSVQYIQNDFDGGTLRGAIITGHASIPANTRILTWTAANGGSGKLLTVTVNNALTGNIAGGTILTLHNPYINAVKGGGYYRGAAIDTTAITYYGAQTGILQGTKTGHKLSFTDGTGTASITPVPGTAGNIGLDITTAGTGAVTINGASITSGAYLPISGGTLTGTLTLAADPAAALQAATKQYVDTVTPTAGRMQAQWVSGALVANGTIFFAYDAPYAGTINGLTYFTGNGSFTVAVQINGTNVTGLSAVAVSSSTAATATATAANTFTAGQRITGVITGATGSATNALLSLTVTRSLSSGPIYLDGSAGAPAGVSPQYPSLLSGYVARPPWMVAGVDYGVGIPAAVSLMAWTALSGTGISVNTSTGRIDVTVSGTTISGIDFSTGSGGWLAFTGASNCTIVNCKFGCSGTRYSALSTGVIYTDATSSGLTIRNCIIDGGSQGYVVQNQACLIYAGGGGTIVLEYNWFKNYVQQIIEIVATGTVTYRYNLCDDAVIGQDPSNPGSPAHMNLLQWSLGPAGANVSYNTVRQVTTHGAEGWQFYMNVSGLISTPKANNNTIAVPGSADKMSYPWHGDGNPTGPTGGGELKDNYMDVRGCFGAYHPSGGWVGWVRTGNINMVTGAALNS